MLTDITATARRRRARSTPRSGGRPVRRGHAVIPAGTTVRVAEVEGTRVVVSPTKEHNP